jgi:hypothetical protein
MTLALDAITCDPDRLRERFWIAPRLNPEGSQTVAGGRNAVETSGWQGNNDRTPNVVPDRYDAGGV